MSIPGYLGRTLAGPDHWTRANDEPPIPEPTFTCENGCKDVPVSRQVVLKGLPFCLECGSCIECCGLSVGLDANGDPACGLHGGVA